MKFHDFNENHFIKPWLISLHFISLFHLIVFISEFSFSFHQASSKLRAGAEMPTPMHGPNLKGVEAAILGLCYDPLGMSFPGQVSKELWGISLSQPLPKH